MKIAGITDVPLHVLAAHCVDSLALILYVLSADENTGKPDSMLDIISGRSKRKKENGFSSAEDFEAARRRIIAGA